MAIKYPWMAPLKKSNQMEWHYQSPSDTTRVQYNGDPVACEKYIGEGMSLLKGLKRYMSIPDLEERLTVLSRTMNYKDGTQIYVSSCWGLDTIIITAGKKEEEYLNPFCYIKLIDPPLVVPPMKWYDPSLETWALDAKTGQWIITNPYGVVEVEGVDYIKTYFSWSTTDCPGCIPFDVTVARGTDANILTGSSPNRPFWYKAEKDDGSLIYTYDGGAVPHYMGFTTAAGDLVEPVPENHSIYGFSGCQGQILQNGKRWAFNDEIGSYFLWKAYTEWTNDGPYGVDFSQNGLGYMLMEASISDGGVVLCKSDGSIIKVDCCQKNADDRKVKLWWEYGSGEFMFSGNTKLYELPDVISIWTIYWNACTYGYYFGLFTLPEIHGSCLPIEWTLLGRGVIEPYPHPTDQNMSYPCPDPHPYEVIDCEDIIITAKDRCGTSKTVVATCCDLPTKSAVTIGYTTLQMTISTPQSLDAGGGCPPYSWSYTGDGSLSVDPSRPQRDWATYTAPPTNDNCLNTDSVTLTDCCGESTTLTIFTTNPNEIGWAWRYQLHSDVTDCSWLSGDTLCVTHWTGVCRAWWCSGELELEIYTDPLFQRLVQYGDSCHTNIYSQEDCEDYCGQGLQTRCPLGAGICSGGYGWGYWGWGYGDFRTAEQKAAGCCPMNPLTGLPFQEGL